MTFRTETLADGIERDWVTIYALCDAVNKWTAGEVRYIGKTSRFVWHRVRDHYYAARKPTSKLPVHCWLRKQLQAGYPIHIVHLERVDAGEDWGARERFWIDKYRSETGRLLNIMDGGQDGPSGIARPPETRAKIAAALRTGDSFCCEVCGAGFWRKRREILLGHNRFCSRGCYQEWQRGKPKVQHHGL